MSQRMSLVLAFKSSYRRSSPRDGRINVFKEVSALPRQYAPSKHNAGYGDIRQFVILGCGVRVSAIRHDQYPSGVTDEAPASQVIHDAAFG